MDHMDVDTTLRLSNTPPDRRRRPRRRRISPNGLARFAREKKLEKSDVRENMNRLFVTAKGTKKMKEGFMTEEEKRAIWPDEEGPAGIEFTGLDKAGREHKLGITIWRSLGMTAIKTEWVKMVEANEAKAGDWVDVWGCRTPGQQGFRLVFIFTAGGGGDLIV
ncbi:Unknown protein [Striga hermonthica]|uniref:B3 domain-containing protein n=1 Tax=Striga hermonthica TaxID=68872 RepID=A0A9N7R0Z7_STRHE|nr:Unknown protein [Striga hermonthica]